VAVLITLPLLHPEALSFRVAAPKVLMPLVPKPPVPVQAQREPSASSASAPMLSTSRPLVLSSSPGRDTEVSNVPQLAPFGSGMGMPDGLPAGIGVGDEHGPIVSVRPVKESKPLTVSTGVLQGMLLAPIRPAYPMIAKAARVEGAVIVEAVISRTGTIESLNVVSGPEMLRQSAIDAIREARYQPYRLNGEPTEVQTRITVNFRMGG
jgi:protein TonB